MIDTVILQENVDYQASDLMSGFCGAELDLPIDQLQQIAQTNGYDSCSWTGSIFPGSENPHQLQVKFERSLTDGR